MALQTPLLVDDLPTDMAVDLQHVPSHVIAGAIFGVRINVVNVGPGWARPEVCSPGPLCRGHDQECA